jgi:hypothetical protein
MSEVVRPVQEIIQRLIRFLVCLDFVMFSSSLVDLEILWDASLRSTYPALASSTLGLKFCAYEIF